MTATASATPFDFAPQPGQDDELLQQLGFVPGLRELLAVRQVHALEHATVWVLSEPQLEMSSDRLLGGMSTETGFYLYGDVPTAVVNRAVRIALDRLTRGEWNLAVHPRCGTNLSVGMLMTAGLAIGVNLFLPKDPIGQLIGLGMAAATATSIAPDVGAVVQKYVTTAIPFNLEIVAVHPSRDWSGRPQHFVELRWVEAQSNVAIEH
ncbi:hypothetical protein H6F67_08595 [Microcoleus sp. FACHB-1515]|uniref:DUF6391 domain-containing protein n=1 Tax=Cyanophyceae TaxID=3028117 RepID=UPI0016837177|nr:DUF6391 domain-containing protein [Microcoleus sp. FACHB-1515]MBD2089912.1 hypothetical protein [Microcoleus sp. FACHB-1515]